MSSHLRNGLLALCLCAPATLQAAPADRWVTTWSASPQPRWDGAFALPTKLPYHLWNQTVRQVVRVSVGGKRLRVVLSNAYGDAPLVIGAAHLAEAAAGASIVAGSDRVLHFDGQPSITIPAGASWVSDPVALDVADGGRLALSLYLPQPTPPATFHWEGLEQAWFAEGDVTAAARLTTTGAAEVRLFATSVQVQTETPRLVATLGDSITDGAGSTAGADHRWPDYLAQALARRGIAVANAGISGARVLSTLMGESALARLDRDVLAQPGIETVVLLMGINDIGWPGSALAPEAPPVETTALIGGYRQLIARTHARGVRIVGATLPPFEGALVDSAIAGYYSADKERARQAVNRWVRQEGAFDAVVDLDLLLRDPARPARLLPTYDSGDHLHPGDAGYAAIAQAVATVLADLDAHATTAPTPGERR
ncbi:SGNH/GDSL hydrolase family protein [Pseudoxanthomonas composti]|uniref:SGNH/GDSL hydrolase family protein n=1 Tax=Pseudoxanthomonas composti TaxID=2137479 RepID=A0A4Q1JWV4_9GAMM|nr:SGNH/GDSL hydrolase family protein [Pseudoxanthomonas composti]RXR06148.1 SGNH/GDSL hydrolase family protein [Pseudoxanthomonas composti]